MIFKKLKGNQNRGRKRKLAASAILSLRLLFGEPQLASSNSKTFQSGGNSKTEISRTLDQESSMIADFNQEGSTQPERVLEGSQITLDTPSGQITLGLPRGVNGSQNLDRDREQRLMHLKLRQIEQEIQNKFLQPKFKILQKDNSVKYLDQLKPINITKARFIYFYENINITDLFKQF